MVFPEPVIDDRRRAQGQGRRREDERRHRQAGGRGPVVPRRSRRGIRRDHPQGHGRAAPRHQDRHSHAAPTAWTSSSASRRWPTARRSPSAVEDGYTHKKQTGGSGQYAKIDYTIEPGEPGTGFVFVSGIVGGSIPKEFIPAVDKGFRTSVVKGPLAGYPVRRREGHAHGRWLPRGGLVADRASKSRPRPPTVSRCPRLARSCSSPS